MVQKRSAYQQSAASRQLVSNFNSTQLKAVIHHDDTYSVINLIFTDSSTTPTEMKTEVSIDVSELEKLLTSIVITTKDCHVKSLIEFYIRLEKKISSSKDKWDRNSLPQVIIFYLLYHIGSVSLFLLKCTPIVTGTL